MARFRVKYFGSNDVPVNLIKPILDEIDAEMVIARPTNEAEVVEAGRDADGIIMHGSVPFTREIISQLKRCKVVCRTGVGVDRMDLAAAAEFGMKICNAAGCNSIEVAEQTIGLLIAISRKLVRMNQYVRDGKWRRHNAELHAYRGKVYRITGRTLGIVGLGHVGRQVAPRAQGLKLNVQAVDPYLDPKIANDLGVPLVSLDELIRTSDFISLHAPLTNQTRKMFGAAQFKAMKNTAYLINCARGGLVDTEALYDALAAGEIAGAALDVTDPEPLPADHKILALPNVIVTCHTAANSDESYADCQTHAAREVARVLCGQPPTTEIKDPWLLAEAQDQGFGGV
ncbi:MAG TPA: C-terminal binding protein [Candidatus Binatia bacterium]|jgi:D-3-phosphoglycerate dehydrogenase|nr:C-terminal binding protein [Candidatus Binatia bacterium]